MRISASLPCARKLFAVFICLLAVALAVLPLTAGPEQDKPKKEEVKQPKITEEILVVGEAPKDAEAATVSVLDADAVDKLKPRDLGDLIRIMPAVIVTYGQKNEGILNLRGIDARRIVLLLDGIPVYEPYFGTFDLKTLPASNISSLQVTKGPSSVLYGPNTLGGIVNVITTRPGDSPRLSLDASYGAERTWGAGADGSVRVGRFALSGSAMYQDSNGFSVPDRVQNDAIVQTGGPRTNSDYWRLNLGAKLFYYPNDSSEVLLAGDLYRSAYGMPAALFTQRARYWRFPQWDRSSLSAGGFVGLGEKSVLRFRAFSVRYDNALDQFRDPAMTIRQFRSTYDNTSSGLFGLGEFGLSPDLTLKASLSYQRDLARQQDDVNLPWYEFDQSTTSAAVEGLMRFWDRWTLNAGVSLDSLSKFKAPTMTRPTTTRLNPLLGLRFELSAGSDIHFSFAQKTRFPNMRSLYSLGTGNPDLLTENGDVWELGGSYSGAVSISAAAFAYRFHNMIDSVTLMDGTRRFINIGKARINGFEVQVQKSFRLLAASLNYTYLDHRNITSDRPLDIVPRHSLNAQLSVKPMERLRVNVFGLYGSEAAWFDSFSNKVLTIPAFFQWDATAAYELGRWEAFLKVSNVFNAYYYTEPGFPWRGRSVEGGLRVKIF
jgi:outer membrane cobalamin receptor